MAATASVHAEEVEIEEDPTTYTIKCGNCLEVEGYLRKPLRLPCGHDFCEKCLTEQEREKANIIKCKVCR